MATAQVSTPLKSHHGLFSTKTAGGRMPLTPSPRARAASAATNISTTSPSTPRGESIHKRDPSAFFQRSVSRSVSKFAYSPKSNIAKNRQSPKHLDLGVSDWTLTGTGPNFNYYTVKREVTEGKCSTNTRRQDYNPRATQCRRSIHPQQDCKRRS